MYHIGNLCNFPKITLEFQMNSAILCLSSSQPLAHIVNFLCIQHLVDDLYKNFDIAIFQKSKNRRSKKLKNQLLIFLCGPRLNRPEFRNWKFGNNVKIPKSLRRCYLLSRLLSSSNVKDFDSKFVFLLLWCIEFSSQGHFIKTIARFSKKCNFPFFLQIMYEMMEI